MSPKLILDINFRKSLYELLEVEENKPYGNGGRVFDGSVSEDVNDINQKRLQMSNRRASANLGGSASAMNSAASDDASVSSAGTRRQSTRY